MTPSERYTNDSHIQDPIDLKWGNIDLALKLQCENLSYSRARRRISWMYNFQPAETRVECINILVSGNQECRRDLPSDLDGLPVYGLELGNAEYVSSPHG